MTNNELKNKISEILKTTEIELNNLRKDIASKQQFTREHNFEIENIALSYKQDALSEVNYIFYKLSEQIEKIFEEDVN